MFFLVKRSDFFLSLFQISKRTKYWHFFILFPKISYIFFRFTILRDEFVKLEATASRREIEHEATLAMEREKVLGYEALEMELDGAFVSEAQSGRSGTTSTLLPVRFYIYIYIYMNVLCI